MGSKKKPHHSTIQTKSRLHVRNKHRSRYNFRALVEGTAELTNYVKPNKYGDESIDFSDPAAVKMLNKALLKLYYDIDFWDIPEGYLCPPIPGRADYIHQVSDLLGACNFGKVPTGDKIKCLDIGVGANCVYPIIGRAEYGWSFIGSDIDKQGIASAQTIVDQNPSLKGHVELRLQPDLKDIIYGVLQKEEKVDLIICNPPFHASAAAALEATIRKQTNLQKKIITNSTLNFGGKNNELWCEGGEKWFVAKMIRESKKYAASCFWFSTLVSKQAYVKSVESTLHYEKASEVKIIPMGQGNKSSRIVAWTFLDKKQQKDWRSERWTSVVVSNSN